MDKNHISSILVITLILLSSFTYFHYFYLPDSGVKTSQEPHASNVDVVFEKSDWHEWSIWDTGSFGYSEAATLLRDHGCNVSQSTIPLDKRVQKMDPGDVLVLPAVPNVLSNYSDQEEQTLLDFVERGGNLIVIGEHDDAYGINTRQNKILKNFGIQILPDILENNETNIGSRHWHELDSSKFGLHRVGIWGAGPLKLSDGAESLAYMNKSDGGNYTVVAGNDYGNGTVAGIGDSNFIWNGKFDWGIEYGENKEFFIRLIEYLSDKELKEKILKPEFKMFTRDNCELALKNPKGKEVNVNIKGGSIERVEGEKTSKEIVYSVNVNRDGYIRFSTSYSAPVYVHFLYPPDNKNLNKKVLFDLSHEARGIRPGPSGLHRLASSLRNRSVQVTASEDPDYSSYDAVIVSNPLEEYSEKELDTISQKSNKMILLGEDYFSLKNEDLGFYTYLVNSYSGWEAKTSPINQLGMKRGVRFDWYTIVDKDNLTFNPTVEYDENHALQLFESCSLISNSSFTDKDTDDSVYGEGLNWIPWMMEQNDDDKEPPLTYAAWNNQTYAFADTSPFVNQRFQNNSWLSDELARWIK